MQATVLTFDSDSRAGTVVTDAGQVVTFDPAAFAAGGLRLLRLGQRVRVEQSADGTVVALTISTLPDPRGLSSEAAHHE